MCGIAGWLSAEWIEEAYGARMSDALRHRGPDAGGFRFWPEATLAHRRLSILDLSPTGAQPLSNEDGSVWVIFNGEIYNHRQIRHELEQKGHRFRGRSDTEILPHLYEEEGPEMVRRLRGMFAFAVYDAAQRRLLLARDALGVKPLFYSSTAGRVAFASEIRALREFPGIDDSPDPQAVADFSALLFVPAPQTIYRGIRALEPGEMLLCRLEGDTVRAESRRYRRWAIEPGLGLGLHQAADRVTELIASAVESQLESDVPLGALLSGGIDSSLVCASAQQALQGDLRTFNVRFSDAHYDETDAALEVARSIGSRHETLDMDAARGSWESITGLLQHAGQPFADTSLFAVQSISRQMRKRLTVALSGDGGDEAFGGYHVYRWIMPFARWGQAPATFWKLGSLAAHLPARFGFCGEHMPRQLHDLAGADDAAALRQAFGWIGRGEHRRLTQALEADNDVLSVQRLFEPQWEHRIPPGASRLERLSALTTEINLRLILPNDYLFKVDLGSMRESLEVRVPMLDEDLVEFGLTLPHRLKTTGGDCKRVLREVAARQLPASIANKPKSGFGVPVDRWVDDDFRTALRDTLLSGSTPVRDWLAPETYTPWVEAFCRSEKPFGLTRQDLYQRTVMLLSLHLALQSQGSAPQLAPEAAAAFAASRNGHDNYVG